MNLGPGARIGSYLLEEQLGEGGMGAVFRALHEQIGRRVAIKVLRPELARSPCMLQRFLNEARAANRIHHPGVVAIYEHGTLPDGGAYIIMELLSGQTLSARMQKDPPRVRRAAVQLGKQIASAVAAAHEQQVLHRDLKPDNLMLVPDPDVPGGERVKILDFGIAKLPSTTPAGLLACDVKTRTGAILGTPRYMSPEQCLGRGDLTDRTDVYSLGLILYEMLAGQPPFLSDSAMQLVVMQMQEPPPPLWVRDPAIPTAVVELVHRMLHKKPEARPSMDEVVAVLDGRRTLVREDDPEQVPLARRKGPPLVLLLGSAFLLLCAAGLALRYQGRPRASAPMPTAEPSAAAAPVKPPAAPSLSAVRPEPAVALRHPPAAKPPRLLPAPSKPFARSEHPAEQRPASSPNKRIEVDDDVPILR